jgi:hypothetical protein
MVELANGGTLLGFGASHANVRTMYKTYLKYVRDCAVSGTDCWAAEGDYTYLNGDSVGSTDLFENNSIIMSDGTFISFRGLSYDCTYGLGVCYWLYVDINGIKGPNIMGKDIFKLDVTSNGVRPHYHESSPGVPEDDCIDSDRGETCGSKVLQNIDY